MISIDSKQLAPFQQFYFFCLKLLPDEFRYEYGEPMLEMFTQRYQEERVRFGWTRAWLWLDALLDLVRVAVLEHLSLLWQDLSFALRMVKGNPLFYAMIVAVLTLAIGANTAIFSVINAVLLRSFPYPRSDQLVFIWGNSASDPFNVVSMPDYLDWQRQGRVFSGMAIFNIWSGNLTGAGEPEALDGAIVSANFFGVLGIQPQLGRTFLPEEDTPEADGQVVARRCREMGIRLALGATPADVLRLVLTQGMTLALLGLALGLVLALPAMQSLTNLLFAPGTLDWLMVVPVALALSAVALIACYLPARRATRIDPAFTLRGE
ncbi:FtsX-like permease family protein [Gloeobacter kilaueensis]|uniref:Macrolide transporter ATP-binding /permease protein n=1 Tax=Gloeobacter kilaueensis (strain ATCC BAA-2537 / CCAP 1431/1 / ULC 316 / JS1) TaxID=1183438 RepID=U5QSU8_GLOK1|nr:FtsX-like permease family protein [Gloeobacter kilaueensis]AGY60749.1 macrolide transporter ATP-binding /permease protein [Gloeobacter kilaueensis JS1]